MGQSLRVIVIGGGAAGFFGAIACAESHPNAQVTVLEASRQPLAKVRISGGGRCNVTHACYEPAALVQHYPRGGKALRGAFTRFQPRNTVDWFQQRGVRLKTEADGRLFPTTDDSATVVECLRQAAHHAGVTLKTGSFVTSVQSQNPGFEVQLRSGELLHCDRLLLATGSHPQGHHLARSLGHQIEAPVPSLFTFHIPDAHLHQLAGIAVESVHAWLRLPDRKPLAQSGALLITHWGFSGPAILKLSAWEARTLYEHHYRGTVQVNWLPEYSLDALRQTFLHLKEEQGRRTVATHSPFPLSRRLWQYLSERAEIPADTRWAELSKTAMQGLIQELSQGQFAIAGKGVFKDEFVTCGGVRLSDVNFKTMESRVCPGLYLAGEILDIDGITGGFNFQSAWTTGWIAGQAIGTG